MEKEQKTKKKRTKNENKGVFRDFATETPVPLEELKKKPTKMDMFDVRKILSDFGIYISQDISENDFESRLALQRFMKDKIDKSFK